MRSTWRPGSHGRQPHSHGVRRAVHRPAAGTVDGQENPLGIITGNKFEEVQSYCTLTEHVYTPYYVVMNQAKWDSLTAEQQEALTKAIEETTQRQYELSQQYEDEAIEVMEAPAVRSAP